MVESPDLADVRSKEGKADLAPATMHIWSQAGSNHGKSDELNTSAGSGPLNFTTYIEGQDVPRCPDCGSGELRKSGLATRADGSRVQRYRCVDCNHKFRSERIGLAKPLKAFDSIPFSRQICVTETKNLDPAATETELAAGVSQVDEPSIVKNMLLNYSWTMQKQNYSPETVRTNTSALRTIIRKGAKLLDPESVKEALAREQAWSPNRKRNIINAYTLFLKYHGLKWEKPRCKITKKIPFIPIEQEIDDLIAGCPQMISTMLQLLKETAMRSGEAKRLKWIDIDLERRVITLNDPEKGSLPRIFNNLSSRLLGMLKLLPVTSPHVFGERSLNSLKAVYQRSRKRVAFKLANPRLLEIHFHTLRHWKASMEYHYTKDIIHVKDFLGHNDIKNTLIYISIDKKLFQNLPDDCFVIRAAHTVEEATKLGEVGFEPFVVMEGVQLFRKRK